MIPPSPETPGGPATGPPGAGSPESRRAWRLALAALFALATLLATRELNRGPLEVHEAYVVETAREMGARGEWVVPYFNDRPRLRKPPLSYWLVAAVGRATGAGTRLEPWHGRLVSALAGIGLVAIVVGLAVRLYDRPTALLAGAMTATTQGFFHWAHNARSDLLYAFWAGLAMVGFLRLWEAAREERPDRLGAVMVWGSFAAGTLTKGPQIPAMLLVAFGLWAWREGGVARRAWKALHPVVGTLVWIALAAPWWLVLEATLGSEGLEGTQLSGSLLRPGIPGLDYLYRVPQLLAPWSLLLPVLAALPWRGPEGRRTRWLAALALVPTVILSLGSQQRAFYVLPVLAPFLVLIAAGAREVAARAGDHPRLDRLVRWLGPAFAGLLALAAAAILVLYDRIPDPPAGLAARAAVLIGVVLLLGGILARWAAARRRRIAGLYGLAAVVFALYWLVGGPVREWSKGRARAEDLAATANRHRTAAGLYTYDLTPDPYVYYAGPPVEELETVEDVLDRLQRETEPLVVFAEEAALDSLPATIEVTPLEVDPQWKEPRLVVARLEARRPAGPAAAGP